MSRSLLDVVVEVHVAEEYYKEKKEKKLLRKIKTETENVNVRRNDKVRMFYCTTRNFFNLYYNTTIHE